jgi:hypothetical protein
MSQRSDLQSVEEFFASLSPPSKAEEGFSGRGKKVARRRGKSVAENKNAKEKEVGEKEKENEKKGLEAGPSMGTDAPQHQRSVSQQMTGQPQMAGVNANLPLDQPFDISSFDITSPSLYQHTQSFDPNYYGNSPQFNQTLHFVSTLPAIDRQMVFGAAYSGFDPVGAQAVDQPSASGMPMDASMGNFPTTNAWEQLDMSTYGFSDAFMNGGGDIGSSAWLLPFNIEPPSFGGSAVDDLGNSALDGMDLTDVPGDPTSG